MAQSNYTLANKSAPASRAKINDVFQSIATNNSGSSAPATTFPHQWWYDTTTNILKQRNAADSDWINIGSFDQGAGTFSPSGVVLPPELSQGQVEDSNNTTFGIVSGQRLAQAVNAFSPGVTTASVLNATAGASAGAVGTYVWARDGSNTVNFGATRAGSNLNPTAGATQVQATSMTGAGEAGALSGTWRCMGRHNADILAGTEPTRLIRFATLWLRIS